MQKSRSYHNLWGAASSLFSIKELKKKKEPLIIVAPDNILTYEAISNELTFFSDTPILYFPPYSIKAYAKAKNNTDICKERSITLFSLINNKYEDYIILTTPNALLKKVPSRRSYFESIITVKKGDILPQRELERRLDILGYIQVEYPTDMGEWNKRGYIVDIFTYSYEDPIRIEYFDEEIEAIYTYDISSQTRLSELDSVTILPATDLLIDTASFINGINDIEDARKRAEFGKFAGFFWYAPFLEEKGIVEKSENLLDYISSSFSIISFSLSLEFELYNLYESVLSEAEVEDFSLNFCKPSLILERINNLITLSEVSDNPDSIGLEYASSKIEFTYEKRNLYQSMQEATARIKDLLHKKIYPIFVIESDKFAKILQDFLRDYEIRVVEIFSINDISLNELPNNVIFLFRKRMRGGFIDSRKKLAIISDQDIFGFVKRKPKPKKVDTFSTKLVDLEVGDYVVHIQYGIGIYYGITHKTIAGSEGDFLEVHYEGSDILYLPLHAINQMQKYIGLQDSKPKLNSLKSSAWMRVRENASKSAKKVAEDLLRLYAERKAKRGFAFNDDGSFLEIFERNFEFEETEDQYSAILDVYNDMREEIPMERLICGDVGFGKTEVAMRAACKAVASSKQVAVLCPTTVLARQHFKTFSERFSCLPVKVDFVSRFRSDKEIKMIFKKVAEGEIDILIGTHKILSKDLIFKNLGLLVIDEEQRFGVNHKERISSIKRDIDTLSMTATPIPRTLQLSLSGIRDMSVIETPPENRLPVIVQVLKSFDAEYDAMRRELERGGQVFFLHNRVANIDKVAFDIKQMLPNARIGIGHGQMDAKTLDKVLSDFYNGDIDILVASTIIENGINIPNVNTMIINHASSFGLAQLYQLKGRVGRGGTQGYCYLLVDDFDHLSEIAQKRLTIIQQLSALGSGFKIAMYDLQLRGAGNILGAEQSGFVVKVGYELYLNMIEEAVQEIKGEKQKNSNIELHSNINYFIPAAYIENPRIRFDFYRRFALIYDIIEMDTLLQELAASYGDVPKEVRALALTMLIKNIASELYAIKIILYKKGSAKILFANATMLDIDSIMKASRLSGVLYRFLGEFEISLSAAHASIEDDNYGLELLAKFLLLCVYKEGRDENE